MAVSARWDGPTPLVRRGEEAARTPGLLDLRGFGLFLGRRLRLIAMVAAATMALVIVWLVLATPRYTATTILIVDPRQQRILQSEAVLAGIGADAAAVESQVEVIQSSSIARAVTAKMKLDEDPEFNRSSLLSRILARVGLGRAVSEQEISERVLARFAENLRVQRRGLTYVLEIRYTSTSAEKAARLVNALASAYLADQSSAKVSATSDAAEWLKERVTELRKKVGEAERAVATYKAENNIVDAGEGRTLADRQVTELNQQLILARSRTADAKARLDQLGQATAAAVGSGAIPEVLLSPVVTNLRTQYAEAARREAETLSTLGPKHPAVATARAQLADIRSQIEREIVRVRAGVKNEYEVALSRERALERDLTEMKSQAGRTGQANVRLRELEREAQASRTLLEQSLLRLRETSEQEGLQRPDARILSPATPPLQPSEPKSLLVLLAGLAGSVMAGIGAAGIAESLSRGYRTQRDVEASLDIPVLGHLPLIGSWKQERPRGTGQLQARTLRGPTPDASGRGEIGRYGVDLPLTPFGEALRTVRSRLAGSLGDEPVVIAILSAVPDEGKSTVAVNLAHSFAKSGFSTLLIDVDVRKSAGLGAAGAAQGGAGLIQLLGQEATARECDIRTDPVSGLRILPLGRVADVAEASELICGPAMKAVLARLRERFRIVILDAPPLLPFADGRELLDIADAGLFVVEWNRTDPESASAALQTTDQAVGKFAGIVMNKVDLRAAPSYGYGYGDAARAAG